jgi:hypothetical protein
MVRHLAVSATFSGVATYNGATLIIKHNYRPSDYLTEQHFCRFEIHSVKKKIKSVWTNTADDSPSLKTIP